MLRLYTRLITWSVKHRFITIAVGLIFFIGSIWSTGLLPSGFLPDIDKARSLSGYVTTADGRMLIFSMLCNNYVVPTATVNRVQDSLAVRLASLRLPAP